MKHIIHVDILNEKGADECYERTGGLLLAIYVLVTLWLSDATVIVRPGKGDKL